MSVTLAVKLVAVRLLLGGYVAMDGDLARPLGLAAQHTGGPAWEARGRAGGRAGGEGTRLVWRAPASEDINPSHIHDAYTCIERERERAPRRRGETRHLCPASGASKRKSRRSGTARAGAL